MTDLLRASAGGVSSETLAAAGSAGIPALLESPRSIKGFDARAQALVGATPEIMKVFGFAGWSGSGKTTLIEQLIPRFVAQGLRVSLIKHAHHAFDIDRPGKDSYRHREAGCQEVVVCSATALGRSCTRRAARRSRRSRT